MTSGMRLLYKMLEHRVAMQKPFFEFSGYVASTSRILRYMA
jgi:hypothetical protein